MKVTFPGGEVREVPSRKIPVQNYENGQATWACVEQPIFDPKWAFVAVKGGWVAVAR